jgi:hypothetical protein
MAWDDLAEMSGLARLARNPWICLDLLILPIFAYGHPWKIADFHCFSEVISGSQVGRSCLVILGWICSRISISVQF